MAGMKLRVDPDRWKRVAIVLIFGFAVGWLVVTLLPGRSLTEAGSAQPVGAERGDQSAARLDSRVVSAPPIGMMTPDAPRRANDAQLLATLEAAAQRFSQGLDRDTARAELKRLADMVDALDPIVGAQTLISFLESGRDAATGLDFRVGQGGELSEAPSLRVSAIDLLGRTGSPEAADYSMSVMDDTTASDEYAVALRNMAWGTSDGTEVGVRFSEMLDRDEWLEDPTAGFMEAFDVAVAVGGPQMVAELSLIVLGEADLADGERAVLNQPAFIALDRLMLRDPGAVATAFRDDPELLSWAPVQRASLLSRADVSNPSQRDMLGNYLSSTPITGEELAYFINIFPNVNGVDGNRLVTEGAEIRNVARIDTATLAVLREWVVDPRFSNVRPAIASIIGRLDKQP